MKKYLYITIITSLFISILFYFMNQEKPFMVFDEYNQFHTVYTYEDKVNLMMIHNQENVQYHIEVSNDYKVTILDTDYQNTGNSGIELGQEHENTYVTLEVFNESSELVSTYEFYFTRDLNQLNYIDWTLFQPFRGAVLLFGIVLAIQWVSIGIIVLIKRFDKTNEPKSNLFVDLFKSTSISKKISFTLTIILFIVIPQILVFILVVFYLYQIYEHKKSTQGLLLSYLAFFALLFASLGLYLGIVYVANPSSRYQEPIIYEESNISLRSEDAYLSIVDESDYYDAIPLIHLEENEFSLLALNGYHTGYWFGSGATENPKIGFILYPGIVSSSDEYELILITDGQITKTIDLKHKMNKYQEVYIDLDVNTFKLELRSKTDNSLVYETDELPLYQDINDYPRQLVTGLQHTDDRLESFMINQLGVIIGLGFLYLMMYGLRNILFNGILEINFFILLLRKKSFKFFNF